MAGKKQQIRNNNVIRIELLVNIIRMIKASKMRWAEHVSCMGEKRKAYKILVGSSGGKNH
jgi:hypothetical protein